MGLNIKNAHVHELARTAARRTGTSQTAAIKTALEQYLAELDTEEASGHERRRAEVAEIVDDMRQRIRAAGSPQLSTDALYDESGLPE